MQPYQQADEEIRRQGEAPYRALATGAGLAGSVAGIAGAGVAASRVLPFLNKYIPAGLAIKGLSKIDPRFGTFVKTAMENGQSIDDVKDFIKEKIGASEEKTVDKGNIIQKYSQTLFDFLSDRISKGESPMEAASSASRSKKDDKAIKQMEKDYKADWYSIVESVFGKGDSAQPQAQAQQTPQDQPHPNSFRGQLAAREALANQQQPQQMQPQQGQPGQKPDWNSIAQMLQQTLAM